MRSAISSARTAIDETEIDVVFGTCAPPEALLLALEFADMNDKPCILDLRDPWSYQPNLPYRHYVDFVAERRLERRTLARASAVVVTTEATADLLVRKLSVPRERIYVIANGFDERDFRNQVAQPPIDRFVVTHAGELTLKDRDRGSFRSLIKSRLGFDVSPLRTEWNCRSPKYLLAAAAELLKERPELTHHLRIQLIGVDCPLDCPWITEFPFPECLRVSGRVTARAAVTACQQSHVLVVMQNRYSLDHEEFCVAIPAKLYTYLRSGRRILACVPPSEIADIIEETGSGVCVPPEDIGAIKSALSSEFDAWQSGRPVEVPKSVAAFDRRVGVQQLADLMRCVVRK